MPDISNHDVASLTDSIKALSKQLSSAACFGFDADRVIKRNRNRFKVPSLWVPPENKYVDLYMRLLDKEVQDYKPRRAVQNLSWIDRKACAWLKANKSQYVVVDCDKNLGDAIILRSTINDLTNQAICEGFKNISIDDHRHSTEQAQRAVDFFIQDALSQQLIPQRTARLIGCKLGCHDTGRFRIRLKIHKNPVKARPVSNLTHSWIQPIAFWLCEALAEVQGDCKYVTTTRSDTLSRFSSSIPADHEIATIDAVNLYPSIESDHMLSIIKKKVKRHYGIRRRNFAIFICNLLTVIVHQQVIFHNNQYYVATSGIATGLACGVFLANIYLSAFDEYVCTTLSESSRISNYFRFVDDVFLTSNCINQVLEHMLTWRQSISWEISGKGSRDIPFLDIALTTTDGKITHNLHRKAQNAYLYLPNNSCHPRHCKDGIARAEAWRMAKACPDKVQLQQHIEFFIKKMARRGYSRAWTRDIIKRTLMKMKRQNINRTGKRKNFYVITKYSSTVNKGWINKMLQRHQHVLNALSTAPVNVTVAFRIQKNLFRKHYADNWLDPVREWRDGTGFSLQS